MVNDNDERLVVTVRPTLANRIREIDGGNPEDYCRNAIYNQLKRDEFERGIKAVEE